jgi:hypothetical protein
MSPAKLLRASTMNGQGQSRSASNRTDADRGNLPPMYSVTTANWLVATGHQLTSNRALLVLDVCWEARKPPLRFSGARNWLGMVGAMQICRSETALLRSCRGAWRRLRWLGRGPRSTYTQSQWRTVGVSTMSLSSNVGTGRPWLGGNVSCAPRRDDLSMA